MYGPDHSRSDKKSLHREGHPNMRADVDAPSRMRRIPGQAEDGLRPILGIGLPGCE